MSSPYVIGPAGAAGDTSRASWPARYVHGWGAAAQLVCDALLAVLYAVVVAVAAAGVALVLAAGIGLLVLAVVALVAMAIGYLERARLAAFTGVDVPAPPGPPEPANVLQRYVFNARPWKALLYLLLLSIWGLVAGTTVLVGIGGGLAIALLPVYGDALPEDRVDLPFVADVPVGQTGWVALTAVLVVLLLVPLISTLLVKVDVALVRGLLGAGERERVAQLSQRVVTLTRSREQAVDSVELERRRIERDLHDGPQQRLVAIAMELGMARQRLDREPASVAEARELLDKAHASAKEAIVEMRQVARGIHPPVLTDRGLDAALSALAARSPIPVQVHVDLPRRPSPTIEAIAYFCVSEALTNVTKHSRASAASVDVRAHDHTLLVTVEDNGAGGARPGTGTGLPGLADRVSAVDGRLWLDSPPGGPTRLTVQLPWLPAGSDASTRPTAPATQEMPR